MQEELWLAIEEVRTSGNFLHEAAHDYTMDVLASRKREGMEGRAADMLKAVTRLLVLIDLIDINELFKASSRVSYETYMYISIKDNGFRLSKAQQIITSTMYI